MLNRVLLKSLARSPMKTILIFIFDDRNWTAVANKMEIEKTASLLRLLAFPYLNKLWKKSPLTLLQEEKFETV